MKVHETGVSHDTVYFSRTQPLYTPMADPMLFLISLVYGTCDSHDHLYRVPS